MSALRIDRGRSASRIERDLETLAAHDTMCVAEHVPSAMVFVPCKDGISHHPAEDARPADGALAAEIVLNAIRTLV